MRIAGYIENPTYKITLLHMNHRYAIKFENEGLEQTYKVRESEVIANIEDVKHLVDDEMLQAVDGLFQSMSKVKAKMISKTVNKHDDFEEII